MKRESPARHEDLREWLRRGDPLSEGVPPDPEMRQLRARVLIGAGQQAARQTGGHNLLFAAIPAGRSPAVWAGGVILALTAAFMLWVTGWAPSPNTREASMAHSTPPHQQTPPPAPAVHAQADASPLSGMQPAGQPVRPEPVERRRMASSDRPEPLDAPPVQGTPVERRRDVRTRPDRRTALQGSESADAQRRPLQVQFTTPGGTRIVWVLNPNLALQPLQQEE